MFGSTTIEILIGVIIVFILVSTICTSIREGIESLLKTRAAYLEQGIRQLLNDPKGEGLASKLFNHPLVFGLFNGDYKAGTDTADTSLLAKGKNLPSYIPSKNFAQALMDIAAAGAKPDAVNSSNGAPVVNLDTIRQNISNVENPAIQRVLLNAVDTAQGDLNKAQLALEDWYNSGMDRVSGWYKRSTQWIIFWIALSVAVGLNVDTLKIIDYLAKSDTARKVMIKEAEALNSTGGAQLDYKEAQKRLDKLNLPIGWTDQTLKAYYKKVDVKVRDKNGKIITDKKTDVLSSQILLALLGWLITALAATIGAPYWFDLLNKVMVVRSTIKPNEKTNEKGASPNATPSNVINIGTPPSGGGGAVGNGAPGNENHDGCDLPFDDITADEELPVAKGGVAL